MSEYPAVKYIALTNVYKHGVREMIRCHLSTLMGARKMKLSHVAQATGLHRNTLTALYYERAQRVDLTALERLCELFECEVGDLLEYRADESGASRASLGN